MADRTHIEWADATWNIVTGCDVVSPGCTNCYAMRLAGTRLQHHPSRAGLTKPGRSGPVWTGEVRFNGQWLDQPLRWRKPRRIFVAAHGDLFHPGVSDAMLDQVFAVMAMSPQHTFQVLTKRPGRALLYLTGARDRIYDLVCDDAVNGRADVYLAAPPNFYCPYDDKPLVRLGLWPLPNVWIGVSVEDQQRANERIPTLLDTPAAVRFVSAEPLLGSVDLDPWMHDSDCQRFGDGCSCRDAGGPFEVGLDWVIVGGESGPGARPMQDAWAYSLLNQCRSAGVNFFMKQMGGHPRQRPIPEELMVREWSDAH